VGRAGLTGRLIAVDWGTSSLRGALLDDAGRVLEEKSAPLGILNVPGGDFAGTFASHFSDWMRGPGSLCLISGMAGSRQGWQEAPYAPCPAGPDELVKHLHWIEPGRIAIVPGLSDEQGGVPDVMRGEEVQIFGALRLTGLTAGTFVLPGTHNKWVAVRDGKVTGFRTYMTGEIFGLLCQHSILSRTTTADAPLEEEVFRQGLVRSAEGSGLLHTLFGARALALFERLSPAASASYLYGLLIGEELRTQSLRDVQEVVLIGAPVLTARYELALSSTGVKTRVLGAAATWAGLHALGAAIGAKT
jgi:2-dehydro-3-deoxygalactonokinase